MRKLLPIMLLMLTASQAPAGEQEEEDPVEDQTEAAEQPREEPGPQADNLRNRELGEAFRNFRPSEEISADNAVSFPVDI